jgi:Zn finger protein HypA/HybF involved in hydrogenase expression
MILNLRSLIIAILIPVTSSVFGFSKGKHAMQDTVSFKSHWVKENERCFKCHGQEKYEYTEMPSGLYISAMMLAEKIVERKEFYSSSHKSFSCTDCHSEDYVIFPHPGKLKAEIQFNCLDCHGDDEKFARFHFEEIDSEYQASVHFRFEKDGFSCWECHEPHSFKISIRNSTNLKETIQYDNSICLDCHSNYNRLTLFSNKEEVNLEQKHEWLEDVSLHFKNVRCIDCHTRIDDSILVSHMIIPKEDAVRDCNGCHSKNSILMTTLYKFRSKERRSGFSNGIILNESFVIGANRNIYLNVSGFVIFSIVFLFISVHIYFRKIKKHS